jgi:general secretion pathway protein K
MICEMNFRLSRSCSKNLRRRNDEAGIALVSVLWLLLLLCGLAATVSYIARVDAMLARRALDLARAQAAADAAIANTIARLLDKRPARHPSLNVPEASEFDGIPITVTVSKEAGRIDVNAATDELLLAFVRSRGLTEDAASTLVTQLRNWQETGSQSGARPNPLATIAELQQIPSWREQNLNCWMTSLTVYSGQADIVASNATPGALAAVRWMQAHRPEGSQIPEVVTPGDSGNQSILGDVIRIHAFATASTVSTSSEWIGRLTGDLARPTLTMLWEHAAKNDAAACSEGP